jgi:hypothetical protein
MRKNCFSLDFFFELLVYPEDRDYIFLRNIKLNTKYFTLHSHTRHSLKRSPHRYILKTEINFQQPYLPDKSCTTWGPISILMRLYAVRTINTIYLSIHAPGPPSRVAAISGGDDVRLGSTVGVYNRGASGDVI